ncbi:MAG TPA: RnfABCDGE type electron transport complex subunit B [bacterium]|nr:RnfABCDGE type electron transport complex subunit B [bacterium]HMW32759.1 RnfABCDGE type electron transport complex subunit B [bacterium]HMW36453.1 RnfABCDGE type electron transport complex subunit B [bacterium]HMY36520.1 RnfABCDGE type electron transport complex subunit B [bacterium]HNB09103.1 RnfABCDGE type electron transport complex subunit B [bacterium]
MFSEIIIAVTIMVGLGLLFASVLAFAYKKLRVEEDPRIDQVESMLPGSNCGACGRPGCRAFAESVVGGINKPGKCTVSSPSAVASIAEYLGVAAGFEEKRVARLLCAGGKQESHNQADYYGKRTCRSVAMVTGGTKDCVWGCLGLGDCESVCDFNAITMNSDGLPVVDPVQCTACNDCVDVCPKKLFTIMPVSQKLIVQCRSLLEGDAALERCSVACNACTRCVADAAPGLIQMKNNLPVIDYSQNVLARPDATRRCPTRAIVWVEGRQFEKAPATPLPIGRVEVLPEEL